MREIQPRSLSAVVELALQKHGASGVRDLARRAEELDLHFSHTMLGQLRKGTYNHPLSRESREKLSKLSGVPAQIVDDLAGAPALAPFELPERAANLTGEQRSAVLSVIGAFVAANEALQAAEGDAAEAWAAQHADPKRTGLPGQSYDPDLNT